MKNKVFLLTFLLASFLQSIGTCLGTTLLVPMDASQKNHLKAYGMAYWVLTQGVEVDWLLNYRSGSFAFRAESSFQKELLIRGVSFEMISDGAYQNVLAEIGSPEANMEVVKLEKAPKIAVYSPKTKLPWDDAVTMVLTYAEIPYTVIFDDEVLTGELPKYDWLHLFHEDFTGQYGKFWSSYRNQPWYLKQTEEYENSARKHGFNKVSELKLSVVKKIRDFCAGGGFLFAMCSATDTYDIALSAEGVDICEQMFDGDGVTPNAQQKLDFSKCFAFENFNLSFNPYEYEYSTIDNNAHERGLTEQNDYFTLFEFSAKWDQIPTMLTQCHERVLKGFMGQTTAFKKTQIKSKVLVLGENKSIQEAKYIHGSFGNGTWTFYGGHDPEDYQHFVGEEPTDLNLHPNSPGFRLILNNILFPAAKKKKQKT